MHTYVINFEMTLYGPYHSEQQAKFAQSLFNQKYPNLADSCCIRQIDLEATRERVIDPRLLH
ncbi:MAG: hypothetical protein R8K49_01630 [Mariprofundaceae bacterium]